MPERPLLLFPTPAEASRSNLGGGGGTIKTPEPQQQWDRLSPKLKTLEEALEKKRVEIQQSAAGIVPEEVLVIETIGSIKSFVTAVTNVEGLEWMGEIEIDDIKPDEFFFDTTKPDKDMTGRLYLVMTNQQALKEVLSTWEAYKNSRSTYKFKKGKTGLRGVFEQLKDIRRWDVQDRFEDTGVIDSWKKNLQHEENEFVKFELELWFRGNGRLRKASEKDVTNLIQKEGGQVLSQSVIDSISYHGILAELPAHTAQAIIKEKTVKLTQCEQIMFFRPVGQMMVGDKQPEGEQDTVSIEENKPLPSGKPVVAVLDGLPLANHQLLENRLIIDDPDNWGANYPAPDRRHGTSMASLVIHGDLNQNLLPLSRPVYIRPIMKPVTNWDSSPRPERIPDDCLIVDLIHSAVVQLFKDNQEEDSMTSDIKVINLSIGDPTRQFTHSTSPLARLLDWLSVTYNVLFIVSAGNHGNAITLDMSLSQFTSLSKYEQETLTIEALYKDERNRKLLSPAETINGITVGAAHLDDAQNPNMRNRIDLFSNILPSPVSAFGSGYRRSIKPDIIYSGGRQVYSEPLLSTSPLELNPSLFIVAPGNKAASPGNISGQRDATSYSCGTSNATALVSRAASICYNSLQQILNEQTTSIPQNHEVPLLKAMLVHGCSWGDMGDHLRTQIGNSDFGKELEKRARSLYPNKGSTQAINRQYKSLLTRWMGYGLPDINRVLECTEKRATLLGYGELSDGNAHVFQLPLPPSLSSLQEKRRLTVTLAWLSPISPQTQKYRTASLWFETEGIDLSPDRQNADWQTVRRGTVQHEIFEGEKAVPFSNEDVISIKVNCRHDAGKIENPIAYGLVVSLEVAEDINVAVYNEIKDKITTRIQQKTNQT